MKKVKKPNNPYRLSARITGIVVTVLMFMAVGFKLIGEFIEKGIGPLLDLPKTFTSWSDPTAFSYTYFIGYAISLSSVKNPVSIINTGKIVQVVI